MLLNSRGPILLKTDKIDPQVLDAVRREAKRRGLGYQSLINGVLAKHVRRVRSA